MEGGSLGLWFGRDEIRGCDQNHCRRQKQAGGLLSRVGPGWGGGTKAGVGSQPFGAPASPEGSGAQRAAMAGEDGVSRSQAWVGRHHLSPRHSAPLGPARKPGPHTQWKLPGVFSQRPGAHGGGTRRHSSTSEGTEEPGHRGQGTPLHPHHRLHQAHPSSGCPGG